MAATSYFDINGRIGMGVFGTSDSDYPDPEALIAHMDYLGIARTLVWDYMARDANPTRGNQKLIETIGQKDEFQRRLFPVFSITPASVLDKDGLALLKTSLADGSVKALRVFPFSPRFNLGALHMLFEEIKDFTPAVLWSGVDGRSGLEDFCEVAERFSHFTFVLAEAHWMNLAKGLDLLKPHGNVLIDTSWLYMHSAIEILTDYLGGDRVVFGTGFKAHYGASIAALEHAKIDDETREKIAHGNIERILGLSAERTEVKEAEILNDKPLWKAFKEGQPISGAEVLDAHGHSGPYGYFGWTPSSNLDEVFDNIVKKMDAFGISRIILSHIPALYGDCLEGNRELQKILLDKHQNRIWGYLVFNPYYKDVLLPELDNFFASGVFKGFKLLADYWHVPLTDPLYEEAWKYADKYSLPILLHTWEGIYSSPAMLSDIVKKCPQATFIIGHAGGTSNGRKESVTLAQNNENVFLEFCGSFCTPVDWLDTLQQVGFDRVVFGSDTDGHNQAWELARLLSLPVADEKLRPVLAENMKNILAKSKM